MINIVMFGPPGAGKGTQAKLLSDKYGFVYIATGDMFRRHIREQTELGRLAQSYIDRGDLVPDEITIDMIREVIAESPEAEGYIFDGFPRTRVQAKVLDDFLENKGDRVDAVFALEVPEEVLIRRILNRGKTSGRKDDTDVDTIKVRLEKYKTATRPLKDYYREKGVLYEIDGLRSIEDIHAEISEIIDGLRNGNGR
ncbi:MAG: adenylate kinase [Chlorobi bacterium]|nr:adenylate kinase [Chlorobiota bacterium]